MMKRKERSSELDDAVAGDDDDDDRLSSLPDDVIGRILSFLPTRQAARTTRLSRRWRRVWPAHVAALNLSVLDLPRRRRRCPGMIQREFAALAGEALLRFPTGIPSISVEVDHYINVAADGWFGQAMERAVGSVRVTSLRGLVAGLPLPPCARAAAMAVAAPRTVLTLPGVDDRQLSELSLSLVRLGGGGGGGGERPLDDFLSSCCPRLRRLRLRGVRGRHAVRRLALHTLDHLEVLDIDGVDDLEALDVSAPSLRCLNVRSCFRGGGGGGGGDVAVTAPGIEAVGWHRSYPEHLTFRSGLARVRRLDGPLKLAAVGRRDRLDAPYTTQLLRSCSLAVGHLDMELVMPDDMALANWLGGSGGGACEDLIRHLPELPRVTVLSLNIRWSFAGGGGGGIAASLASLLSKTPSLTRLHIRTSPYCFSVFEGQEEVEAVAVAARGSWHMWMTDGEDDSRKPRLGRRLDSLREVSVDGLTGGDREEYSVVVELLLATIVPPSLERMSLAFHGHAAPAIIDDIAREIPLHFPIIPYHGDRPLGTLPAERAHMEIKLDDSSSAPTGMQLGRASGPIF
uniref:F-box domain-containing protein n=1 Tax=Oryza glumipatula TaxID=40148 RepID=A0A0E0BV00_9ORYZ